MPKIKQPSKKPVASLEPFIKRMATPEGFTRTDGKGHYIHDGNYVWNDSEASKTYRYVTFTKKEIPGIRITINYDTKPAGDYSMASGHVSFQDPTNGNAWFCFDRRGIEDSFYIDKRDMDKLDVIIKEQLQRIEGRLAMSKATGPRIPVPGTEFAITQARKDEITASLRMHKLVALTPSGFGTGLTLTVRPQGPWSRRQPELEKFFGVSSIYGTTFDHD